MENSNEENEHTKRAKEEASLMFNISERTVSNYLLKHLEMSPEELFTGNYADLSKADRPLALSPIAEYSDKYIAISLKIVPYDYVSNIPEQLKENEHINHALGLFYHAVSVVFNAIIAKQIKESSAHAIVNASFHLEMDDESLTFYPIYIYPKRRTKLMLINAEQELDSIIKSNIGDKERAEYKEKYDSIVLAMNDLSYDEKEAYNIEKEANSLLKTNARIGFVLREVTEAELSQMDKEL